MATFKHIKFGDGLTVIDEGAGVITVNGAGGPPGPTGPAGATGATGPAGAPAYPAPVVDGQWVKGVAGAAVWAAITEADVTNLTTDLAAKQATAQKGVANGYASLDASGLVPLAQLPATVLPGAELAFAQITANKTVTATNETSADLVVAAPAVTFDGATVAVVSFFARSVGSPPVTGATISLLLYLDGASIGYLTTVNSESASGQAVPVTVSRRLTPAAGSRQFSIGAIVSGSSGNVVAGPGGVGQQVPAYIRVCRA